MRAEDFFNDGRVRAALQRLPKNVVVSDIVDSDGHQYVDIVMEGGGVLGIALLGYVYALEAAGIRFLGVGGTSAGAINAVLTAAAGEPKEPKSPKVVELLANMDMWSFVDGDCDARDFVKAMVNSAGPVKLLWKAAQVLDNLNDDLGLNPGKAFYDWVDSALQGFGVRTVGELERRMRTLDGLKTRRGVPVTLEQADPRLAIVAADITTETKVVFPAMAHLYWKLPKAVSPARFVRASMSIPFFFHPYWVDDLPNGPKAKTAWLDLTGYKGDPPEKVAFVDGGIISNFPIDLFHAEGVPFAPTFGVKLGMDRREPNPVGKPLELASAVFNSARHYADYDFVYKNPDYSHLIAHIDTGKHGWLQFDMADADKLDLFARGVERAVKFLNDFNWTAYKKIRKALAEAEKANAMARAAAAAASNS